MTHAVYGSKNALGLGATLAPVFDCQIPLNK
jgi:hypothetical protein